jgi:hypothetical protein
MVLEPLDSESIGFAHERVEALRDGLLAAGAKDSWPLEDAEVGGELAAMAKRNTSFVGDRDLDGVLSYGTCCGFAGSNGGINLDANGVSGETVGETFYFDAAEVDDLVSLDCTTEAAALEKGFEKLCLDLYVAGALGASGFCLGSSAHSVLSASALVFWMARIFMFTIVLRD